MIVGYVCFYCSCNWFCTIVHGMSLLYEITNRSLFPIGITVHLKFPYSRNCDEEHLYLDIVTHTVTRLTDRGAQYASMKRPEPAQSVAFPVSNVTLYELFCYTTQSYSAPNNSKFIRLIAFDVVHFYSSA